LIIFCSNCDLISISIFAHYLKSDLWFWS